MIDVDPLSLDARAEQGVALAITAVVLLLAAVINVADEHLRRRPAR